MIFAADGTGNEVRCLDYSTVLESSPEEGLRTCFAPNADPAFIAFPIPALRGAKWSPRPSAHTSASLPAGAWRCARSFSHGNASSNFLHRARAAIVGRHRQPPVAKLVVQRTQILRRRQCRGFRLTPLVERPQTQAEIFRRRRHELKHPNRAGRAPSARIKTGFHFRQPDQFRRHAARRENRF